MRHELRRLGHDVQVFEARDVPGGLDTLGIAAYKISTEFALAEIAKVREIGIEIEFGHRASAAEVHELLAEFDAVFLGIGLGRTLPLEIDGEDQPGVWEALDFIFQTHTGPLADCMIGLNVVVIGAGNTAIDVATAARRLGAESVTIVYRRSEALIPAFAYEYELAKADGVRFEWCAQPIRILSRGGSVTGVEFVRTKLDSEGSRSGQVEFVPGSNFFLPADMVVKALGQEPLFELVSAAAGARVPGRAYRRRPEYWSDECARPLCGRRLSAARRRDRRRRAGRQDRGTRNRCRSASRRTSAAPEATCLTCRSSSAA